MKKITQFLFLFLIVTAIHAQNNIGIGTTNPTAKLQINHKNTSNSPTLTLFDSAAGTGSKLLFAKENQGNSFSIVSNIDLLSANGSLDFRTTFASGILLKGNGMVGINQSTPAATLHVNGGARINDTLHVGNDLNVGNNINVAGKLKIDGNSGTTNQVLVSNGGAASPSWQNLAPVPTDYTNMDVIEYSGANTIWTVPAGVSKVIFEGWSGGGIGGFNKYVGVQNERGGGSGAYFKAMVHVTPGIQFSIRVPNGQTMNFVDKDSIFIQKLPISGLNDKLVVLNADSSASGRKIRNTGILSNVLSIEGSDGGFSYSLNGFNKGFGLGGIDANYQDYFGANGGSAPFGGSGGMASYDSYIELPGSSLSRSSSSRPGKGKTPGGGSSNDDLTTGGGLLIIWY